MAFNLKFQSADRTLTSEEVDDIFNNNIVEALNKSYRLERR